MCYKTTFDSTTYHLNLSPMFLDCLLLDQRLLTSCPLFIWTKFGSKLQKILKCGRPGGGGSSVISDTPDEGERGEGKKRGQIFADVLHGIWMAPMKFVTIQYDKPNPGPH